MRELLSLLTRTEHIKYVSLYIDACDTAEWLHDTFAKYLLLHPIESEKRVTLRFDTNQTGKRLENPILRHDILPVAIWDRNNSSGTELCRAATKKELQNLADHKAKSTVYAECPKENWPQYETALVVVCDSRNTHSTLPFPLLSNAELMYPRLLPRPTHHY
jgi:hypothetical protein